MSVEGTFIKRYFDLFGVQTHIAEVEGKHDDHQHHRHGPS